VFNFTTITIPANVNITLTANVDNAPVYWLATGKVDIEGTLSLDGGAGVNIHVSATVPRVPAVAGSGGYGGGLGGNLSTNQNSTSGSGPGGGPTGCSVTNTGGTFTGNQYLVPLVGGSGGAGSSTSATIDPYLEPFGSGGGAGGGAILIASSAQIIVNGALTANGGAAGGHDYNCNNAGGGSGGAIRLVSNTISGTGTLSAQGGPSGGYGPPGVGTTGRIRLEFSNVLGFTGSFNNTPVSESAPYALFIPTVPPPSVRVTSINGTPITENPFTFPDITISTDRPVAVVITGHQVPIGTVPTLVILGENADQNLTCPSGLQGTLATSTCTIAIAFNYGGSRGLVKTIWQNPGSQ
jgi:hypothetical protein